MHWIGGRGQTAQYILRDFLKVQFYKSYVMIDYFYTARLGKIWVQWEIEWYVDLNCLVKLNSIMASMNTLQ
jgi:hypothetical protein